MIGTRKLLVFNKCNQLMDGWTFDLNVHSGSWWSTYVVAHMTKVYRCIVELEHLVTSVLNMLGLMSKENKCWVSLIVALSRRSDLWIPQLDDSWWDSLMLAHGKVLGFYTLGCFVVSFTKLAPCKNKNARALRQLERICSWSFFVLRGFQSITLQS